MENGTAIVNGVLSPLSEAKIPLLDRGFLFAHSVFETILVLDGRMVFWNEHMERLLRGCERLCISRPDVEELLGWSRRAIKENILQTGNVAHKMQLRIIVTGGGVSVLWNDNVLEGPPLQAVFCRNVPSYDARIYGNGMALKTFADLRSPEIVDVKSSAYVLNMLALREARQQGFDDALLVREDGRITESTTANFLWLNAQGEICSCPNEGNCLPGTTVLALRKGLAKAGLTWSEVALHVNEPAAARACFIASSTRGVVPVKKVDVHSYDVLRERKIFEVLSEVLLSEQLAASHE